MHKKTWLVHFKEKMIDSAPTKTRAARVYLRVSTEEQDFARKEAVVAGARTAGYNDAAIHR